MSAAVELPLSCRSPGYEKTYEELCIDWLQLETTRPSTPQAPPGALSAEHNSSHETSLWIDLQQWTMPPLSPQLPFTGVQSPRSFRPYGTPLANDTFATQPEDGYFSRRVQTDLMQLDQKPYHQYPPPFQPVISQDQSVDLPHTVEPAGQQLIPHPVVEAPQETGSLSPRNRFFGPRPASRKRKANSDVDDHTMRITHLGKTAGRDVGVMVEWGKQRQGRGKMEKDSLESYRVNRKHRACSNCSRGRRKCGRRCFPYIECLKSKPLIFLDRPTSMRLFRSGPAAGHPLFSEKSELYNLRDLSVSLSVLSNRISQGIPGICLPIQMTDFLPHPKLKTSRSYVVSSRRRVLEMPRLCLASIISTTRALHRYIEQSWYLYLQMIMLRADKITQNVLREAIQYTTNRHRGDACIVHRALKLLALGRIIELDWAFTGDDISGVDVVGDFESPWFKTRPVTPVMDTQLDQIVIQTFLLPLRSELLEDLNSKMVDGKRQNWFEVFLATFILQTHTALLLRHSRKNAVQCGATHRYNSLALAEEYFHGSNILLAHFIHGRNGVAGLLQNKAMTVGIHPNQELFLRGLAAAVHSYRSAFSELRASKQYEADMYWTHQMFLEDWVPEDRVIVEA